MSAQYSLGRFYLLAEYKRQIQMKRLPNSYLTFFVAMLFPIVTGGNVMAGGLVDTSVERFEAANFSASQNITNPWWTLPADSNFLYFAQDGEDCLWNLTEALKDTTNNFGGIYSRATARVVLDRGWVDQGCKYGTDPGAFSDVWHKIPADEVTYDWYAQDDEKNIWYMGEDTFDGVDFAGSFVAGCDGAQAGIVVLANPSKGDFYRQEFYEGEAEDWAKVLNFASQDGLTCMTTKEWSPLEPGAVEQKVYCSNGTVGQLSQIEEHQGKTVVWELVDTNIKKAPSANGLPIDPTPSCQS